MAEFKDHYKYIGNPIYDGVAKRFRGVSPQIRIEQYITRIIKIGPTISEGIEFECNDYLGLFAALRTAKDPRPPGLPAFHYDDPNVPLYRVAAAATHGSGFREIGSPSLHVAVNSDFCSAHVDEFGFVDRDRNGGVYFTPNTIRHILDELGYRGYARPAIKTVLEVALPKVLSDPAGKLVDRTYLSTPDLSNNFDLRVGPGIKILDRKRFDMMFEFTCGNLTCSDRRYEFKMSIDLPDGSRRR